MLLRVWCLKCAESHEAVKHFFTGSHPCVGACSLRSRIKRNSPPPSKLLAIRYQEYSRRIYKSGQVLALGQRANPSEKFVLPLEEYIPSC
jgi:hypothetical protein